MTEWGRQGQVLFLQINFFFKLGQLSGISIVDKERPFSYAAVLLLLLLVLLLLQLLLVVVCVVCLFWGVSGLPYLL